MGSGDAPMLEVVDEYDADGDGRVTREEYLAGFLRDGIRPVRKSNSALMATRHRRDASSPLDGASTA